GILQITAELAAVRTEPNRKRDTVGGGEVMFGGQEHFVGNPIPRQARDNKHVADRSDEIARRQIDDPVRGPRGRRITRTINVFLHSKTYRIKKPFGLRPEIPSDAAS